MPTLNTRPYNVKVVHVVLGSSWKFKCDCPAAYTGFRGVLKRGQCRNAGSATRAASAAASAWPRLRRCGSQRALPYTTACFNVISRWRRLRDVAHETAREAVARAGRIIWLQRQRQKAKISPPAPSMQPCRPSYHDDGRSMPWIARAASAGSARR